MYYTDKLLGVDYDRQNGLFVELGSGSVVSVTKNGTEFHCRSLDPPTPSLVSGSAPENSAAPAPGGSLSFAPRPSRIPTSSSRGKTSPGIQSVRKGTPVKAAVILGLSGSLITSSEDEPRATPTKHRSIRNNCAGIGHGTTLAAARGAHLGKLASQNGRSSSTSGSLKPGELPAKRSVHLLGNKTE